MPLDSVANQGLGVRPTMAKHVDPKSGVPVDTNDLIGKKFERGARGPEKYDCHGLAIEVFRRFGIDFPDKDIAGMAAEAVTTMLNEELDHHINVLKDWEPIEKPEVPCLIILKGHFQFANHLGVYIGKGRFIHAAENKYGGMVCVNRLSDPTWRMRIAGYYKYTG